MEKSNLFSPSVSLLFVENWNNIYIDIYVWGFHFSSMWQEDERPDQKVWETFWARQKKTYAMFWPRKNVDFFGFNLSDDVLTTNGEVISITIAIATLEDASDKCIDT